MKDYVAIDLETTGLSAKNDKIIEIGAIKVKDGMPTDRLQLFVDPGKLIPERITELTGITQEMLKDAVSVQKAMEMTCSFCEDLPLLGHNILFDFSFLKQNAVNLKMEFQHMGVDTLKIARQVLPKEQSCRLTDLCTLFHIGSDCHHRAVEDAMAAKELYDCLYERYNAQKEKIFEPKELVYQAKKQGLITPAQKRYLNDLIKYHKIEIDYAIEQLSKNEASRKIDGILLNYGRIK